MMFAPNPLLFGFVKYSFESITGDPQQRQHSLHLTSPPFPCDLPSIPPHSESPLLCPLSLESEPLTDPAANSQVHPYFNLVTSSRVLVSLPRHSNAATINFPVPPNPQFSISEFPILFLRPFFLLSCLLSFLARSSLWL